MVFSFVNNEDNNKKANKFTSAMGDLKGLLDKEGINLNSAEQLIKNTINSANKSDSDNKIIPTLNMSDIEIPDVLEQKENIPRVNKEVLSGDLPVLTGTITVIDEKESDFVPVEAPSPIDNYSSFDSSSASKSSAIDDSLTVDDSLSVDDSLPVDDAILNKNPITANISKALDLDDYISDFDDDQFQMDDFADSVKELEEKVVAITEPEHLHRFEETESGKVQLKNLKNQLHKKLTLQIETKIEEFKSSLLNSLELEINELFKNLSK